LIEAVVGRWLLVVGQKPSIGCDKLLNCGLELQPQHSAGSDTCDALKAAPLLNQTSKRLWQRLKTNSEEDLNIPTQAKSGLEWGTPPTSFIAGPGQVLAPTAYRHRKASAGAESIVAQTEA